MLEDMSPGRNPARMKGKQYGLSKGQAGGSEPFIKPLCCDLGGYR